MTKQEFEIYMLRILSQDDTKAINGVFSVTVGISRRQTFTPLFNYNKQQNVLHVYYDFANHLCGKHGFTHGTLTQLILPFIITLYDLPRNTTIKF
jgi:hypothetical protein